MHSVVVILGVRRVDGDERQIAPVLASLKRGGFGFFRLFDRFGAKHIRDVMRPQRNQADGFFIGDGAKGLPNTGAWRAKARLADQIDADQIAVLGFADIGGGHSKFASGLFLVDRNNASAAIGFNMQNAQHAMSRAG